MGHVPLLQMMACFVAFLLVQVPAPVGSGMIGCEGEDQGRSAEFA
jgi:hypothetical protein